MPKISYFIISALIIIGFTPHYSFGAGIDWRSIGVRGGVNDSSNNEDFEQYEGFAVWNLPWSWQWESGWRVGTYLETNAGFLSGDDTSAFIGAIGPGIFITGTDGIVEISMGINPMIISKHKFGDENLGGPVQFASHVGLNIIFSNHVHIGYRFQHMSNARIYKDNPGLDTHMIELGYRF